MRDDEGWGEFFRAVEWLVRAFEALLVLLGLGVLAALAWWILWGLCG